MSAAVIKTWSLLPHDPNAVSRLAASLRTPHIVAQLLLNRGVDSVEQARRFLDAPLTGLHPPDLLPGVPEAADRILAAVKAGRKVCVYGDYDVDGVSGTRYPLAMSAPARRRADLYVPHRLEEGYGLNVRRIAADCGGRDVARRDGGLRHRQHRRRPRRPNDSDWS